MSVDRMAVQRTGPARTRMFVGAGFGNMVEWYDFAVYGFLAVHIGRTFFPNASPAAQLLGSFAVFGASFFARPLGGLFFGPLGDRIGRKRVLVTVLTVMAVSTFLVGATPGFAQIGVFAPIVLVLLRCVQGFSAGGEFGSNTTFIFEHAAPRHRGVSAALAPASSTVGIILGGVLVNILSGTLDPAAMDSWGWRIPFLIAGPLGLVGLYIRLKLEDTPEFRRLESRRDVVESPLRAVGRHRRGLLITALITVLYGVSFYTLMTYLPTYLSVTVKLGTTTSLVIVLVSGAVAVLVMPLAGLLSDRVGRKPVLMASAVAHVVLAVPLYGLLASGSVAAAVVASLVLAVIMAPFIATSVVTMAELFPTAVRSTGVSLGFNIPIAIFGGMAPFVATWLISSTGSIVSPAWYLMFSAVVSAIGLLVLRRVDLVPAAEPGR